MRARVARLQFESVTICRLSRGKFTRITRIVTVAERVFKLLFNLGGIWSRGPGDRGPCRPRWIGVAFRFPVLWAKNPPAPPPGAPRFLGPGYPPTNPHPACNQHA